MHHEGFTIARRVHVELDPINTNMCSTQRRSQAILWGLIVPLITAAVGYHGHFREPGIAQQAVVKFGYGYIYTDSSLVFLSISR